MAIQFVVKKIQDNGLTTSAYDVRMRDGGEYRRAEMVIGRDEDANAAAADRIDALWSAGDTVGAAWFVAAREGAYADYYKGVQLAVQGALSAGGNLAAMNAAGLAVLATDDDKLAEWQAYKSACGAESDLQIHTAMMLFAVIGRQAGGG